MPMKFFLILLGVLILIVCSVNPIAKFLIKKGFENQGKPWAQEVVMTSARIQMLTSNEAAARPVFESGLVAFPNYPKRDKVHYWIGRCYEKERNKTMAKEWYERFLTYWPKHPWADLARRRITDMETN